MHYSDDTSSLVNPPAEEWKPTYWTPMKNPWTLGGDIADFVEKYHTPPRGDSEAWKLSAQQRWLYESIFELDECGLFRYREVWIFIPRKNAKSMLGSGIGNYFLTKGKPGDRIYYAAKDSEQARICYDEAVRNILQSEELSEVIRPLKNESMNTEKDILMKPLAASVKGAHGLAPYISIADELHTWDSATGTSTIGKDMLASLLTGSADQKESLFIGITTAGSNLEGIAYANYQKGKMVALGEIEDDRIGFFCWEAEEHDDIFDINTLRKANPGIAGGWIDEESLYKDLQTAAKISTADFERFHLNKWIKKTAGEEFILPFWWEDIAIEAESLFEKAASSSKKPEVVLGFDGSLTEDSTGIVAIDLETNAMHLLYRWEKDRSVTDWHVDLEEVDMAFRKCFELFEVKKAYLDPSRHWDLVKRWQKDFTKAIVRDIPPTITRMGPLS